MYYKNFIASSFLKPNKFHLANMAKGYEEIKVEILSLTDYNRQNSIESIHILKLDIEGFEIEALKGLES